MFCKVCGIEDPGYEDNSGIIHVGTTRHMCNQILAEYKENKKFFKKNRDQISIMGGAEILDSQEEQEKEMTDNYKVFIAVKPHQEVKFVFDICNESKKEDVLIVGIQLGHPQPQFEMSNHPYCFGEEPHLFVKGKTSYYMLRTVILDLKQ